MKVFISVIIPAFNEEEHIAECITSLQDQNYPSESFEIIIVDNNSIDSTKKIASTLGAIVYQKTRGNVGAVRNLGAQQAKGAILAFIDADCVAPINWLETGAALINNEPETVFGGGCLLRNDPTWIEKNWLLGSPENRLPKDLIGCSIFTTKKVFKSISGFNESLTSGEDTQLSVDLRKNNYTVKMNLALSIVHLGNALTALSFLKRQIWHSENYFKNFESTVKDPTFLLTLAYFATWALLFIRDFLPVSTIALIVVIAVIPMLFSVKRIRRAKSSIRLDQIPQIYMIDTLYIIGRLLGLIKGATLKLSHFFGK